MATPAAVPPSAPMQPALTSDVMNYLVYRYLQESGFSHTSFVFGHESRVTQTLIDPNTVPPGSLIAFVQRGMQYLELQANLDAQASSAPDDLGADRGTTQSWRVSHAPLYAAGW